MISTIALNVTTIDTYVKTVSDIFILLGTLIAIFVFLVWLIANVGTNWAISEVIFWPLKNVQGLAFSQVKSETIKNKFDVRTYYFPEPEIEATQTLASAGPLQVVDPQGTLATALTGAQEEPQDEEKQKTLQEALTVVMPKALAEDLSASQAAAATVLASFPIISLQGQIVNPNLWPLVVNKVNLTIKSPDSSSGWNGSWTAHYIGNKGVKQRSSDEERLYVIDIFKPVQIKPRSETPLALREKPSTVLIFLPDIIDTPFTEEEKGKYCPSNLPKGSYEFSVEFEKIRWKFFKWMYCFTLRIREYQSPLYKDHAILIMNQDFDKCSLPHAWSQQS